MSNAIQILAAEPRVIKAPGGDISVHELSWIELMGFIEKLSSAAGEFVVQTESGIALDNAKLAGVVSRCGDLVSDLVCKSAKLPPEKIAELSPRVVLAIADAALEINCTPDLFASGNAVAARFARMLRPAGSSAAS